MIIFDKFLCNRVQMSCYTLYIAGHNGGLKIKKLLSLIRTHIATYEVQYG